MKRLLLILPALAALFFLSPSEDVHTASSQPPIGKTGRPGEGTCIDCHTGGGGAGNVSIVFNNGLNLYVNDQTYQVKVTITDNAQIRFGFSATVVDQRDTFAGMLTPINFANTSLSPNQTMTRYYIGHANATTSKTWTFNWKAPEASFGSNQVTFYVAGNASNGNFDKTGDYVYTSSVTVNRSAVGMDELAKGFLRMRQDEDILMVDFALEDHARTQFAIYDLKGSQLITQNELLDSGIQTVKVPLGGLTNGIYFLRITQNGRSNVQKFVVAN